MRYQLSEELKKHIRWFSKWHQCHVLHTKLIITRGKASRPIYAYRTLHSLVIIHMLQADMLQADTVPQPPVSLCSSVPMPL